MRPVRSSPRAVLARPWSIRAEAGFVALVLVAWQLLRLPLEGGMTASLAHARAELRLERALHVDVERALMHALDRALLGDGLHWLYLNIHVPVLVAFLMFARVAAPNRYPRLRLTFVLSFVPAAFVIGLYPVAPPRFLPELGGIPPADGELTGSVDQLLHNSTAAAASQHFAFAVFVAAGALWLFPRARAAWLTALYPLAVFLVIVGTANHYVVDCVVGTAALAVGALAAWWLVPAGAVGDGDGETAASAASVAAGYALLAWAAQSLSGLASPAGAAIVLALLLGTLLACGPPTMRPAPATRS